ncbi:hypothetical protein I600_871 [Maribacter dokdonensis DSW-8]|nr:hypothetical protein I600_871 [Maribacter dokdonensis DSW-8]
MLAVFIINKDILIALFKETNLLTVCCCSRYGILLVFTALCSYNFHKYISY